MTPSDEAPQRPQNDPPRAAAWALFYAALAPRLGGEGAIAIGKAADELMREYDDRWSPGLERKVVA